MLQALLRLLFLELLQLIVSRTATSAANSPHISVIAASEDSLGTAHHVLLAAQLTNTPTTKSARNAPQSVLPASKEGLVVAKPANKVSFIKVNV